MAFLHNILAAVRRNRVRRAVRHLRALTVGGILRHNNVTIKPESAVGAAAMRMIQEDIPDLIVEEQHHALGVISEFDILMKVQFHRDGLDMQVRTIMNSAVTSVPPALSLPEAMAIMAGKDTWVLLVERNDIVVGIIDLEHLLDAAVKTFKCYPSNERMTVKEHFSARLPKVGKRATLATARAAMLKERSDFVLIQDGEELLGIITENDIIKELTGDCKDRPALDLAGKYVRSIPVETNLFEAARIMREKRMHRMLVVDGENILGMITQADVCRAIYGSLDEIFRLTMRGIETKRFSHALAVHGELVTPHLKAYRIEE